MSKDYLDRTLEHDPDTGPDQIADRTLNRDRAKEPDREAAPTTKPVTAAGKKPVAAPARRLVSDTGKRPVAAPRKQTSAGGDSPVAPGGVVEQRSDERVEVIIPIEMQVVIEVLGAGKISGATENISCSGMLARLNGPIQPNSRCQLHFLSAADVSPSHVYGRAIRVAKSRFGYSVAFRFEHPVEIKVAPRPSKNRS